MAEEACTSKMDAAAGTAWENVDGWASARHLLISFLKNLPLPLFFLFLFFPPSLLVSAFLSSFLRLEKQARLVTIILVDKSSVL